MSRDLMKIAEDSARGGFFLVAGAFGATFVSAITAMLVARILGPELYGQYALALVISEMLCVFASFGVAEGIVKFASRFQAEGRTGYVVKMIKHAMVLRVFAGLVFFVVNLALADFLAIALFHRPELGFSIKLASLSLIFHVIYTAVTSAYLGLDKTQYSALTANVQSFSRAAISIGLVLLGFGVVGAVLGYVAGFVVGGLVGLGLLFLILRRYTGGKDSESSFLQNTKTLMSFGIPLYLSQILVSFIPIYQNLILGVFASDGAIGNLKAATNFVTFIMVITVPVSHALFPAFSKIKSRINGEIKTFFKFANKYTTMLIVPIPMLFLLFSKEVVQATYGSTYENASVFLSIYCLMYFLVGLGYLTLTSLFNGLGKTRVNLKRSLIAFLTVIVLSPLLAKAYGVPGVIFAYISGLAASMCYGVYIAKRDFGIEFNTKSLVRIYGLALFSAAPPILLLQLFPLRGLLRVVVGGLLYILIYATLLPVTGVVTKSELNAAAKIVKRIRPLARIIKPLLMYQQKILNLTLLPK